MNAALIQSIEKYSTRHPEQKDVVSKFLEFVSQDADCLSRKNAFGHITSSAWLVDPSNTKTLLTHHRKLQRWLQLGGHVEGEDSVIQSALREAQEESGIMDIRFVSEEIFDLDLHWIPDNPKEKGHWHYDLRYLMQAASTDFAVSDESHDLKWFSFEELAGAKTDESVLRMGRKWCELKGIERIGHF
jgi:8-oxo-dGTP pyrophosphatase MutT (NUDIX family)